MRTTLLVLSMLLAPAIAYGQTVAPITSVEFQVFDTPTGPVFRSTIIALSAITCDQPPVLATQGVVNPTRVHWDDPARPGRTCNADITAFRASLPANSYTAAIVFNSEAGQGPPSTRTLPFTVSPTLVPPPPATGVKVTK